MEPSNRRILPASPVTIAALGYTPSIADKIRSMQDAYVKFYRGEV